MQDNKRDYKPFIVFAAAVIVVNVAALWFFLREDAPAADLRESAPATEQAADALVSNDLIESPDVDMPNGAADGGALPGADKPVSEAEVANHSASNGAVDKADDGDKQETDADDSEVSAAQESCVFAALDVGLSGVLVEKIEETDPQTLTDKQRGEWFDLLQSNGAGIVLDACKDFWSEPTTAENADKRNEDYYSSCFYDPYENMEEEYLSDTEVLERKAWRVATADLLELMERPYKDLTPTDRMLLRGYFNQSDEPIYRSSGYGVDENCAYYYPQLFYGRWIPFSYE